MSSCPPIWAREAMPVASFLDGITADHQSRIPGIAVFLARHIDQVRAALLHAIKHYHELHEGTVLMSGRRAACRRR
jgi:K+ transporter